MRTAWATPFVVSASGVTVPRVVVKVTVVPLGVGAPEGSMIVTVMVEVPPMAGMALGLALTVIVDSAWAVYGTLSQPIAASKSPRAAAAPTTPLFPSIAPPAGALRCPSSYPYGPCLAPV